MRATTFLISLLSTLSLALAFAPPGLFRHVSPRLAHYGGLDKQTPMNPGPVQGEVPQAGGGTGAGEGGDSRLSISDILPQTRSINIFASLTRDVSTVTNRLESTRPQDNTTLLAPLNSVMQALPRKPWEDRPGDEPEDISQSAARNEDRAARNLQRFVEEHVVPISPWREGKEGKIRTMGGTELWWEEREGKKVVMPGELVVDAVVGRVGNGEIWAVTGVVNYA